MYYDLDGEKLTLDDINTIAARGELPLWSLVEHAVVHSYREWCKPGDIAIDCGAADGWHTFGLCVSVKPDGHVYAFEALPEKIDFLKRRAIDWSHAEQVTFHQVALGSAPGIRSFNRIRLPNGSTGYSSLVRTWAPAGAEIEEISVMMGTIDQLIPAQHKASISYIKLDLEGGEFGAFLGAEKTISLSRPLIVSEFGGCAAASTYGFTEGEFFEFFDRKHYSLFDFFAQSYTRQTFNEEGVLPQVIAIPNEKIAAGIHHKVARFLLDQLRQPWGMVRS